MVGPDLERVTIDGTDYWSGSQRRAVGATSAGPMVHLVQGYDESIIGYQKTRSALDIAGRALEANSFIDGFIHPILVDSQIAGLWRRTVDKARLVIETNLMRDFVADERAALEAEVVRYGQFVQLPTELASA